MRTERALLVMACLVILLFITTVMGFIATKDMTDIAAYHRAVQHRLENTLINIDESYNDSITAIKYQEYNRLCK